MPRPHVILVGLAAVGVFLLGAVKLELGERVSARAATVRSKTSTGPRSPATARYPAHRRYEMLLSGQRSGILDVTWTLESGADVGVKGPIVRDETRGRMSTARKMGRVTDVFKEKVLTVTLRTLQGVLLSQTTTTDLGARIDKTVITRTATGYRVVLSAGPNEQTYDVATTMPAVADAEAFLSEKIGAGTVHPKDHYHYLRLLASQRKAVPAELDVVGQDAEGPGLKCVETVEGKETLWWFSRKGSVVRMRAGDTTIVRNDSLTLTDLPALPASVRITLEAKPFLPRIFSAREATVSLHFRTDDTLSLPVFPKNPFSRVIRTDPKAQVETLKLQSVDDSRAKATFPVRDPSLARYLKPTTLMEVNDPEVRTVARGAVGDATDVREGAQRIADFVFRFLRKGSPSLADPTAKEILSLKTGDCSEHALLFTALCRAVGIPARRCDGYVCIGQDWGAHCWAEVWVGAWIGADPTTDEVGTHARYILTGMPDDPGVVPADLPVSRMSIRFLDATFDDGTLHCAGRLDPALLSGIRTARLPRDWKAIRAPTELYLTGPGFRARVLLRPDQGYRAPDTLARLYQGGTALKVAGRDALRYGEGPRRRLWIIALARETLYLQAEGAHVPPIAQFVSALRPTFPDANH